MQKFKTPEAIAAVVEIPAGRISLLAADRAETTAEVRPADAGKGLRLTTIDGDVHVGRLGGPAEISAARGGITIGEAVRGTVVLHTQHGDISIAAAPGVSATLHADARHGRVSNILKNDGSPVLQISATSGSGNVSARSL
ncbi:hypothetical protein [Streptomyces sp. NPDC050600]|uniref:hypothetical protein n=1 Tax=unclassified Streptomyces TaxID=2593676 RepID=UPI003438B0F3